MTKAKREFKFYPCDFKELIAKPMHMDLVFDMYEKHTSVTSDFKMKAIKAFKKLEFNAKKVKIKKVECKGKNVKWKHDEKKFILEVTFEKQIKKDETITIHFENDCYPTQNDLEGLYYDKTPKGAPIQQITQCQQWGFQKLVPCFDEMNAKCTYKTKIIADSRYTHLISNGNCVVQKHETGNGRSEVIYDNTKTPMAPYLFCLIAGTYEAYTREFEYTNGKTFMLEFLVPPNSQKEAARKALEILFNGVLWINLFTGAERYKNIEKRKKVFELVMEREKIKLKENKSSEDEEKIENVRKEIKELSKDLVLGYEYTGDVYREIAMQNSNFGGMENVGNTTITANRIMPFKEMSDGSFSYIMEVKEHEFYHNINGSEVTGWSPFELWLNEAITCHQEQDYLAFVSGEDYARLNDIQRIIGPGGTFDEDIGSMGMPIIPDGFNSPDELISGVTYSKGPEVVNMVELLMGKEKFAKALQKYHIKFSHKNATTKDFFDAMEKEHGKSMKKMQDSWLRQIGYPELIIKTKYNSTKKEVIIEIEQKGYKKMPWVFPFSYAIFTSNGKEKEETIILSKQKEKIVVKEISEPIFYSFNRNLSFYGKVKYKASENELYAQARRDDDIVARYNAYYEISDKEKMKLLDGKEKEPSDNFVELFFELLSDENLCDSVGSALLSMTGAVEDKRKAHHYEELYQARKKIRKKLATKYEKELLQIYENRKKRHFSGAFVEKSFSEIKNRQIKNTCISILSELDTKKINAKIKEQYLNPTCQSDKLVGFANYIESSEDDVEEIIKDFEEKSKGNLIEWEQFLSLMASSESDKVLLRVKMLKKSADFNITQSNDQRALLMRFAFNRRKSLLTKEGREFLKECIIELGKINEYNTGHILSVFSQLDDMKEETLEPIVKLLVECLKEMDVEKEPSVYNTIKRILAASPRAIKVYEVKNGKLKY